jgi:Amt family ammonium transporter
MAEGLPLCTAWNNEAIQFANIAVGKNFYVDKYSDASAGMIMTASILIFFMKAGFLFVEDAFVSEPSQRRRVIISKYLDTCTSAIAFWLFGFALSLGFNPAVLGEDHDYIFWFFRFTFASNTATIIGGTLIGQRRNMKLIAVFLYAFMISSVIHPFVVQQMWSEAGILSVFKFCNGTVGVSSSGKLTLRNSLENEPSSTFVLDFAGSGVVHLLGGMGGFFLSVFYKIEECFETQNKKSKCKEEPPPERLSCSDTQDTEIDGSTLSMAMDIGEEPQAAK